MRKSKGYAKGGAKMMKAMGGRMASKGGRKMMGAMKGKMASKGYAKGGAKMLKARVGRAITGDRRPNKVIAKKKVGTVGRAITGDRATKMSKFSKNDINVANRLMNAGMLSKKNFATLKSRLTKEGKKLVKNKN
jgi:hypothetical protein